MNNRFAVRANGRSVFSLPEGSESILIKGFLSSLDGKREFARLFFGMQEGIALEDIDFQKWPIEYLQSAGTSKQMTVEVRAFDSGTDQYLYWFVARALQPGAENPIVEIPNEKFRLEVPANQVFDEDEAFGIYLAYVETGMVPDQYQLVLTEI